MFTQSYQNILIGIDGSDQTMEAFKKALAVASAIRNCLCGQCDRSSESIRS